MLEFPAALAMPMVGWCSLIPTWVESAWFRQLLKLKLQNSKFKTAFNDLVSSALKTKNTINRLIICLVYNFKLRRPYTVVSKFYGPHVNVYGATHEAIASLLYPGNREHLLSPVKAPAGGLTRVPTYRPST